MAKARKKVNCTDDGLVSDEEIQAMMREVFGPSAGWELRGTPLLMLKKMANFVAFKGMGMIFVTISKSIDKGHLPSVKLLIDLIVHLEKFGSIQQAEMQSFADLLILSLEAETGGVVLVRELVSVEPVVVEAGK